MDRCGGHVVTGCKCLVGLSSPLSLNCNARSAIVATGTTTTSTTSGTLLLLLLLEVYYYYYYYY